jgi:hypothetical protein
MAQVMYLTKVGLVCYTPACLLLFGGSIAAYVTSDPLPLRAIVPAVALVYVGETHIKRMHSEIVDRIGVEGAAIVCAPVPIVQMLRQWFFK